MSTDLVKAHVLFLADRKALVRQAHSAFVEHLPGSISIFTNEIKNGKEIRVQFQGGEIVYNIDTEKVDIYTR